MEDNLVFPDLVRDQRAIDHAAAHERVTAVQAPQVLELAGEEVVQHGDLRPFGAQPPDEVRTYEAGATGDQNALFW